MLRLNFPRTEGQLFEVKVIAGHETAGRSAIILRGNLTANTFGLAHLGAFREFPRTVILFREKEVGVMVAALLPPQEPACG